MHFNTNTIIPLSVENRGAILSLLDHDVVEVPCVVNANGARPARDGQFFRVFGRLHPTKHFPHVSLLTIGLVAIPFCIFTLGQLVRWLIQVQILLQFIWQCGAVILLRRYRPDAPKPFRMWLHPLPALISLAMWIYIFLSAPAAGMLFSAAFSTAAVAAYIVFEKKNGRPFSGAAV